MSRRAWAICLGLAILPTQALASPFDQGNIRIALGGGTSVGFGSHYFVIGAGVGYFVMDGWEVAVDSPFWLGESPFVSQLSPSTTYYFHWLPVVHPYTGVFYRHWFVGDDIDDIDTLGFRVGAVFTASTNFYAGGGVVYESVVSECDENCTDVYPEFRVGLSF
ncbi:MAG: hypothetical protein KC561_13950 [Myxococcales bacterium]|nr:hypothetical protein [Myxococcales bacterium]